MPDFPIDQKRKNIVAIDDRKIQYRRRILLRTAHKIVFLPQCVTVFDLGKHLVLSARDILKHIAHCLRIADIQLQLALPPVFIVRHRKRTARHPIRPRNRRSVLEHERLIIVAKSLFKSSVFSRNKRKTFRIFRKFCGE